jgi:hypothetical protein
VTRNDDDDDNNQNTNQNWGTIPTAGAQLKKQIWQGTLENKTEQGGGEERATHTEKLTKEKFYSQNRYQIIYVRKLNCAHGGW